MYKQKQIMKLEIAYDLISQVHTYICSSTMRTDDLAEQSLNVLRDVILLSQRLERSDNNAE
jgi:hypothetical protein